MLIDKTIFSSALIFQSSGQVSQSDGHCVWYGKCYEEDKIKNCAYDGPAKPLDASGVEELKQWCSHLLPQDYTEGQDVLTCCDSAQVRQFQLLAPPGLSIIHSFSSSCSTKT